MQRYKNIEALKRLYSTHTLIYTALSLLHTCMCAMLSNFSDCVSYHIAFCAIKQEDTEIKSARRLGEGVAQCKAF